ncbi:hypothetical protein J2T56_002179 [Natronobacillus azotifigens]|uniref:Lipoprotein n=1 Tax=Natronobacillus azotifigens TaxID=472978 RepID=A0A9J6RDX2_9BACI|nr:hypothetical protein [Natronobacillus azotifigens]MCZ0703946.1 hypothetical protein [Natronobacillus azotifigens]
MKMKKLFFLIFFFTLLLIGCSNQAPIIVQEETNVDDEDINLIEQESEDEEEVQRILEFTLPMQQISLHLDQIPILNNYLAKHQNRKQAIEQMELTRVIDSEELDKVAPLFVLSFACVDNTCSYLLLNTETERSKLLADNATLKSINISPDEDKLLLVFERPGESELWTKQKIIVFDLNTWNALSLNTIDETNFQLHQFLWPIIEVNWQDNKTITVTLPAVNEPTDEQLNTWYELSQNTQEVQVTFD